jgi:peptidoglycan/xylan/chitin deacetylase (PgdA/CDA1 family)
MFDDGGVSTYTEAKPILDRYGYKASMSIVTDFIGEPKFMTLEQIQSLAASGWEVVSHGITHDDLTRMSSAAWHDEMARSKKILEGFGFTVRSFVVPYGAYNADIIRYGTPLYSSIRAYEAGDNPAGSSPYRIRVRQITNVTTPAEVAQWIQEGKSKGRWEVLAFHVVDTSSDDEYYTPPSVFAEMVAAVQASGVPVLTYGQGIARFATVGGP